MNSTILDSIKSLPPLSKTISEINRVYSDEESSINDMVKAVENDPMVVANLLKMANSALYNFGKEIKTVSQAVGRFGMAMTRTIVVGTTVRNLLNVDMQPYGITSERFAEISSLQAIFLTAWFSKDREIAQRLYLPVFLQETGKIFIANKVIQDDETMSFKSEIEMSNNLAQVEYSYTNMTSAQVTSMVFDHWNFDKDVVELIKYSDTPSKAPKELQKYAHILNIIKTIIPVNKPFSEQAVNFGLKKAEKNGFDIEEIKTAIDVVSELI